MLQLQPGVESLPPTTHLTITPVTEAGLPELIPALVAAADAVRGVPHVDPSEVLASLPPLDGGLDSETAWALLQGFGIGAGGLLGQLAPLLAVIEVLPPPIAERLLTELIARLAEP